MLSEVSDNSKIMGVRVMKKFSLVLLVVLLLFLFVACSNPTPKYKFPVSQKEIEELLEIQKSPWHVADVQSYKESQAAYILKTDDGVANRLDIGVTCIIETKGFEDERFLSIQYLFPKDYTTEQIQQFQADEIPRLFDISTTLYGNSKEVKPVLKDFFTYMKSIDNYDKSGFIWAQRVGDNHLLFKMSPEYAGESRNVMSSLSIENNITYERYMTSKAELLMDSIREKQLDIHDTTIDDILKMESSGELKTSEVQYFVVRGCLNDFYKPKTVQKFLTMTPTEYPLSNKENYLTGRLVDNSGSMEVCLQPTSLTAKELKQERTHYLIRLCYEEKTFYVVLLSVLGR